MAQELVIIGSTGIQSRGAIPLPALFASDAATAKRVFEFFTANIRNPHTRRAYAKAAAAFAAWCEDNGLDQLRDVQPVHVAAYVEELQSRVTAPTVKLQLAAIRMLFDWLVVGQVMPANPASVAGNDRCRKDNSSSGGAGFGVLSHDLANSFALL